MALHSIGNEPPHLGYTTINVSSPYAKRVFYAYRMSLMETIITKFSHKNFLNYLIFLFIIILFSGCLGPKKHLFPPASGEPVKTIYVVSHGWHTGLVIDTSDVPDQTKMVPEFFKMSKAIEFGWGDEGFYKSKKFSLWVTIKAAILPTPTVLHLADLRFSVSTHFPNSRIIKVDLSEKGFRNLCDFIASAFFIDTDGNVVDSGPGIYGRSRFYRSNQRYYFPKTCNVWTASALREAGCPITPIYAIRAENVINQTRKFGIVIQEMERD